jgi:hypothetical protein
MTTRTLVQKPGVSPAFATGCLYYPGYPTSRFIRVCA